MHASWLEKIIETEYGWCKLEIQRKDVAISNVIEIKALSANSIVLSLENLGSITDPIGKSVCSFSIIDTDQINYEDFFTPDATAFKVVVSTMVRGANSFTTRWSGFLTPDFFAENLTYRTPISLTARDNIGYLNDVDFDMPDSTVTVRQLIQAAFAKISDNYPMNLAFVSQKQTAEGVLAIDATISTVLLREMSWYEAVETILHDLGLQMRWVDNNTIAVLDLSQIPEYYPTQGFNFIGASGYREILPAWRELGQNQDFGLRENFFEGEITPQNMTFAREQVIQANGPIFNGLYSTIIRYYTPNNWDRAGEMYTINPADFFNGQYKGRIFFTGIQSNIVNYSMNFMSWRQPILQSNWPMLVKFNAYNAIMAPDPTFGSSLQNLVLYADSEDRYQLGLKVNVLLHSGSKTYILRQNWEELNGSEHTAIEFILSELTHNGTPQEEELSIEINSIPHDGELELRIYGFFLNPKYDENIAIAEGTAIKMVSYISDVAYTYDTNAIPTGQDSGVTINEQHNVKSTDDYTFGQVPYRSGGINAFAGGLFKEDGNELIGFQRNAEGENYNLLELVGREVIHFNKKNYNKLSGTIKNFDKEPLMFNRLFVREGKTYAPFSYSLNVISNEMNITTMQEVEPYETASFTQIESEVTTGGGTVGGGNNTVLQYSEKPGNAKRIYELDTASDAEKNDGYLILDNPLFGEAKKVHISEVKDTQLRAEVEDLRADFDNLNNLLNDDTSGVIDTWNEVVDFLEGYKESEDLASILSGINAAIADRALKTDLTALATTVGGLADILATEQEYIDTLQGYFVNGVAKKATADALGNVITDTYATKVALNAVDKRVQTLEALGLTLEVKDGVTYVKSKYSFYTLGGLASGEPSSSGGGGGAVGGSNVSFKAELLSGTKIGTITIDNVATNIYAPSVLANPYALTFGSKTYDGSAAKTITAADLGALTTEGGTITSTNWTSLTLKRNLYGSSGYGSTIGFSTLDGSLGVIGWNQPNDIIFRDGNGRDLLRGGIDGLTFYATINASASVVSSSEFGAFNIHRKGVAGGAAIKFGNDIDGVVGYLGIGGSSNTFGKTAFYQDAAGNAHTLIHSGNIGSYAPVIDNSDSADSHTKSSIGYGQGRSALSGGIITATLGNYGGQLHIPINANYSMAYRGRNGSWNEWKTIVDSDNISNYNAGSATKLQDNTAFTAWGQTFFQNGVPKSVNGYLYDVTRIDIKEWLELYAKDKTTIIGELGHLSSNNVHLRLYNNADLYLGQNGKSVIVKYNGNVLIGATTDNGAKLQVDGDIRANGNILLEAAAGGVSGGGVAFWNGSGWVGGTINASTLYLNNDTSGNVLIGTTTSDWGKLQVYSNSSVWVGRFATDKTQVAIANPDGGGLSVDSVLSNTGNALLNLRYGQNTLGAGGTTALLVKDNGNVLIGATTDNASKLQVVSDTFYAMSIKRNLRDGYGAVIHFGNNVNTLGFIGWNEELDFCINQGVWSGAQNAAFRITSDSILLNKNTAINTNFVIRKGSSTVATLFMTNVTATIDYAHLYVSNTDGSRIDRPLVLQNGYGNVGIGVPQPSAKLHVGGNIEATGGIASRQPSDARLKDNVQSITTKSAVDVLRALNPICFEWNQLAYSLDKRNEGWSVGFIAQDFEQTIPNSGSAIWEKYRAIDYTKAIPYLAKGWQIHDTILVKHADNIEDLRSRVEVLERENRELKNRLNMRA